MKLLISILLIFSIQAKEKKEKLPQVFVTKIAKTKISDSAEYFGKLIPLQEIKIYSPINGIVEKISAAPGNPVRKNQVLGIIKQNVIGLEVLPLKIESPITGNLYRSAVEENTFVRENTLLFTVYNPNQYKLRINIAPSDGEAISIGDKVSISFDSKETLGTIRSISPDIDTITGTRLCEIILQKNIDIKLRPGMLAKASFEFNPRKSFLINDNYIVKKGGKNLLRLVTKDNKVRELEITVKKQIKDLVEIDNKLLKEEDQIITQSTKEPLKKNQVVKIITPKSI